MIEQTGSAFSALLVWCCCGAFSLLGALCYAELGTSIPRSGGDYAYIHEAFGAVPAFVFLWMALLIVNPASIAIMALTCATYALQAFFPQCAVPFLPTVLLSTALVLLLTAVNCYNVRWSTVTQDVSSVTKVAALLLIVLAGLFHLLFSESRPSSGSPCPQAPPTTSTGPR